VRERYAPYAQADFAFEFRDADKLLADNFAPNVTPPFWAGQPAHQKQIWHARATSADD
jgi:hypothetical protein